MAHRKLQMLLGAAMLLIVASSVEAKRALAQENLAIPGASADVIVIGAGMAGISLGRYLANNSSAKVILLEARDRSGGRLYSVQTAAGRVDEGAMWIHNAMPGNELYDLAIKLNLPLSKEVNYVSAALFDLSNSFVPPGSNSDLLTGWLVDMTGKIESLRTDPMYQGDLPLLKTYQDYLKSQNITPQQLPITNLMAHTAYQVLLNANLTELSTLRYGDAKTLPAIDVFLRDGFDSITNTLKKGLDVRYNTTVVNITETPTGVLVKTADGTAYQAKYAVTTLSLGCMKAATVGYNPPLPDTKLKAIKDMGMGVLDKVILVYDEPFWNSTDFISREMPDLSGLNAIFLNYRTLNMTVLVALNVADTARRLENQTDAEILNGVLSTLRMMYSDKQVPDPREFYITRWAQDPYARGSYSFFAVGNDKNITTVLAEPVGRFLFAGEATSDNPATVLGAYQSGIREGKRVKDLLAKEQ